MNEAAHKYEYFTWENYQAWPNDERWELIDGHPYAMSPAPGLFHQVLVTTLSRSLGNYFVDKECMLLLAPTDVKLSDCDVVQPDLLVVCDRSKLRPTHVEGAPDLLVEILSPSTAGYDRGTKLALYAKHGVREYWLVTPYPSVLEVLVLDGESYRVHKVYRSQHTLRSPSFPGLELPLERVFDFPIPPEEIIDEVRESPGPYAARDRTASE